MLARVAGISTSAAPLATRLLRRWLIDPPGIELPRTAGGILIRRVVLGRELDQMVVQGVGRRSIGGFKTFERVHHSLMAVAVPQKQVFDPFEMRVRNSFEGRGP